MEPDPVVGLPGVDYEMGDGFRYAQEHRLCHEVDPAAADQGMSRHPNTPMLIWRKLEFVHGSALELEVAECVSTH